MSIAHMQGTVKNSIPLLRLYGGAIEAFPTLSVLVFYFEHKGLDFTSFLFVQSMFSLMFMLFEIPTGYLADRFPRRLSLVLGGVLVTAGFFYVYETNTLWGMIAAFGLVAAGRALASGASSALLYDLLAVDGRTSDYKSEEGKMRAWGAYALALSTLIGAGLYMLDPELPQLATILVCASAIPLSFMVSEPEPTHKRSDVRFFAGLRDLIRFTTPEQKKLTCALVFSGLIAAASLIGTWTAQPYLAGLGVPVVLFGILFAGQQFIRGLVSDTAGRFIDKVGEANAFLYVFIAQMMIFLLQGTTGLFGGYIVALMHFVTFGVAFVLVMDIINRSISGELRAMANSVVSMVMRLCFFLLAPVVGLAMEEVGAVYTFYLCAAGIFVLGLLPVLYLQRDN